MLLQSEQVVIEYQEASARCSSANDAPIRPMMPALRHPFFRAIRVRIN